MLTLPVHCLGVDNIDDLHLNFQFVEKESNYSAVELVPIFRYNVVGQPKPAHDLHLVEMTMSFFRNFGNISGLYPIYEIVYSYNKQL